MNNDLIQKVRTSIENSSIKNSLNFTYSSDSLEAKSQLEDKPGLSKRQKYILDKLGKQDDQDKEVNNDKDTSR